MRTLLFLIILLILNTNYMYAQEFNVDYKIQYKYTHHSNLASIEHGSSESLYLLVGENQSVFTNYNVVHQKQIQEKMQEMLRREIYDSSAWGERHSEFNKQYYKNHAQNSVLVIPGLEDYSFAYLELRTPLEWTILDQGSKNFLDFKVFAATTTFAGRNYTAWFAPEISIIDGPHVFYGLPGLVVDVYDSDKHFRFQLEGIEMENMLWKLPNYKQVTYSEYEKASENSIKMNEQIVLEHVLSGAVQYEEADGTLRPLTKDEYLQATRKRKQETEKNHNPMELEK